MKIPDIVAGVFLALFGSLVFFQAGTYATQGVQIEYFGPAFFPRILSLALVVAAVALVFNAARGRSLRKAEAINWPGFRRLVLALFIGVAYWLSIDYTGFLMGTPVFLFLLMTALGARSWPKRLIGSLAAPVAIWALFEYFLVISLPESEILYRLFGEG